MRRREEQKAGEVKSDDLNKAEISLLSSLGGVGDAAMPLRKALSPGTEPNDSTPSCFMGGADAGGEEMGGESTETSSMEVARKCSSVLSLDALLKLPIEAKGAHPNLLEIPRKTGGWQST